jgi:hypothetical protein
MGSVFMLRHNFPPFPLVESPEDFDLYRVALHNTTRSRGRLGTAAPQGRMACAARQEEAGQGKVVIESGGVCRFLGMQLHAA